MKTKRSMIWMILAVISVVVITVGVTYAFFNYVKEGSTENSMTTGTITFLYTEVSGVGRGISISNAFPVSDEVGKAQVGEGNVFDFKVTSTTPRNASIPYEVTARMKSDSTLDPSAVKVYLTEVKGDMETEILLDQYSSLVQTSISVPENITEKTLYTDTVPANSSNYEKNFRLRMWISEDTDFSDGSMNGKTFTLTVNVYANAEVVTQEEIVLQGFAKKIYDDNTLITAEPTLTTSSNNSDDASGLYRSTNTNSGNPTYYFRGEVENNYVSFAGFTWRIIRINEDGTVRLIMQTGINDNALFRIYINNYSYEYMYYTNGTAKTELEEWYDANLAEYDNKIATGNYFCEEAKVKYSSSMVAGNVNLTLYSQYRPTFECQTDANGYGLINTKIGLISYDEIIFTGMYYNINNSSSYLSGSASSWTTSPGGIGYFNGSNYPTIWYLTGPTDITEIENSLSPGSIYYTTAHLRAVINLDINTMVTGSGTSDDPYVVQ